MYPGPANISWQKIYTWPYPQPVLFPSDNVVRKEGNGSADIDVGNFILTNTNFPMVYLNKNKLPTLFTVKLTPFPSLVVQFASLISLISALGYKHL